MEKKENHLQCLSKEKKDGEIIPKKSPNPQLIHNGNHSKPQKTIQQARKLEIKIRNKIK